MFYKIFISCYCLFNLRITQSRQAACKYTVNYISTETGQKWLQSNFNSWIQDKPHMKLVCMNSKQLKLQHASTQQWSWHFRDAASMFAKAACLKHFHVRRHTVVMCMGLVSDQHFMAKHNTHATKFLGLSHLHFQLTHKGLTCFNSMCIDHASSKVVSK